MTSSRSALKQLFPSGMRVLPSQRKPRFQPLSKAKPKSVLSGERGSHATVDTTLDYTEEQVFWLRAVDTLKSRLHRTLTDKEVFRLATDLGYRKEVPSTARAGG